MWQPPPSEIQNGRVRLYISVFEVQTGTNYSYTLQPSEDPTLQVESLHPYYDYVCSVAAVTIGPRGHPHYHLQLGHLKMVSVYPFFLMIHYNNH